MFEDNGRGFVMCDFRPFLNHVTGLVDPEAQGDLDRIGGVVQSDANQFAAKLILLPGDALVDKVSGSIAIRMDDLDGRFPDITIASLGVSLAGAEEFWIYRSGDRVLIKAAPVTHLETNGK